MAGEYIEFDNNNQPAVNDTNLNRLQQLIKQDIVGTVGGDTMPIGAIIQFGSTTIPTNWLECDGSAVSRTTYQDLFNTIGITYGQGDGFSTFNLPNLSTTNVTYIIKAAQSAGVVATVIDNLNSTSTTDALSANQGKVLNEKIEDKGITTEILATLTSGTRATVTVPDLSQYSLIILQAVYHSDTNRVLASVIGTYEQFKSVAASHPWEAAFKDGSSMDVSALYVSDTSVTLTRVGSSDATRLIGVK